MARSYMARHGGNLDPRFSFEPGMLVLLCQKVTNKNQMRARGPFTFLTYSGQR